MLGLGVISDWGAATIPAWSLTGGSCAILLGIVVSGIVGHASARSERNAAAERQEQELGKLRHDIRRSLTVIQGEVELILTQDGIPAEERRRSSRSIVDEVTRVTDLLQSTREQIGRVNGSVASTSRLPLDRR